jgi:hypothetical protein
MTELPGVMPRELRKQLKQLGHKLGNPMPSTATFKPQRGWTTRANEEGEYAGLYDPNGRLRLRYYPAARFQRLVRDARGNLVPTDERIRQPYAELVCRYELQPNHRSGGWIIFDRVLSRELEGTAWPTEDAVASYMGWKYPDWRSATAYWNDPTPTKWWQFWRRNR